MNISEFITIVLLMSFFYSFTITTIAYTLPEPPTPVFEEFQAHTYDIQNMTVKFEQAYQTQTSIPLVDMAALVFTLVTFW
jgi:hypothetical protein